MTLTPSKPDPATGAPGAEPPGTDLPDPNLGTVRLSGHATTVTAEDLRTQLVLASDNAAATMIDASETLSIGQAVLQLLIAARREAASRDHHFHFSAASTAFSERVTSCQLADAIGLETAKEIAQ